LVCGIYDERPEICKRYPESGSYTPERCSFWFDAEGNREGECDPHCQASCCMLPRLGGEPGGAPLPEIAGGMPCRYLISVDEHPALSGERPPDPEPGADREGDREEPSPLELALAAIDSRQRGGSGTPPVGV